MRVRDLPWHIAYAALIVAVFVNDARRRVMSRFA
jgi:hypothetical protein